MPSDDNCVTEPGNAKVRGGKTGSHCAHEMFSKITFEAFVLRAHVCWLPEWQVMRIALQSLEMLRL